MKEARSNFRTLFNFLVRVVGVGFILVGGVILIYGANQHDWITIGSMAVVVVLGVLLLLARPNRQTGADSTTSDQS